MGQLLTGQVAAVSVGIVNGVAHLDLDYSEDSTAEVDFNVVMTDDDRLIEVQGTAEHGAFTRQQMDAMVDLAAAGIRQLFALQRAAIDAPPARVTRRLLIATTNRGKQREFRRLLDALAGHGGHAGRDRPRARGRGAATTRMPRTRPPRRSRTREPRAC